MVDSKKGALRQPDPERIARGQVLARLLEEAGLTDKDLADVLDKSDRMVRYVLSGERNFSRANWLLTGDLLGVPVSAFGLPVAKPTAAPRALVVEVTEVLSSLVAELPFLREAMRGCHFDDQECPNSLMITRAVAKVHAGDFRGMANGLLGWLPGPGDPRVHRGDPRMFLHPRVSRQLPHSLAVWCAGVASVLAALGEERQALKALGQSQNFARVGSGDPSEYLLDSLPLIYRGVCSTFMMLGKYGAARGVADMGLASFEMWRPNLLLGCRLRFQHVLVWTDLLVVHAAAAVRLDTWDDARLAAALALRTLRQLAGTYEVAPSRIWFEIPPGIREKELYVSRSRPDGMPWSPRLGLAAPWPLQALTRDAELIRGRPGAWGTLSVHGEVIRSSDSHLWPFPNDSEAWNDVMERVLDIYLDMRRALPGHAGRRSVLACIVAGTGDGQISNEVKAHREVIKARALYQDGDTECPVDGLPEFLIALLQAEGFSPSWVHADWRSRELLEELLLASKDQPIRTTVEELWSRMGTTALLPQGKRPAKTGTE